MSVLVVDLAQNICEKVFVGPRCHILTGKLQCQWLSLWKWDSMLPSWGLGEDQFSCCRTVTDLMCNLSLSKVCFRVTTSLSHAGQAVCMWGICLWVLSCWPPEISWDTACWDSDLIPHPNREHPRANDRRQLRPHDSYCLGYLGQRGLYLTEAGKKADCSI